MTHAYNLESLVSYRDQASLHASKMANYAYLHSYNTYLMKEFRVFHTFIMHTFSKMLQD